MVTIYPPNLNDMKNTSSKSHVVRIIDPRHPLYDRTFPLVKMVSQRGAKRICVVITEHNITRHVPLEVTDKYEVGVTINQLPISVESLSALSRTYFSKLSNIKE